jgi:hypothetical protein
MPVFRPSPHVLTAALVLAPLAVPATAVAQGSPPVRDTVRAAAVRPDSGDRTAADSTGRRRRREVRPRIPLTPALEADAFRDEGARRLLAQAREARLRQDARLDAYTAVAVSRLSVGLGIRSTGRPRLALREESASRVSWTRAGGASVDIVGSRSAVPIAQGAKATTEVDIDLPSLPYYPGREALWIGGGLARAEVDPDQIIHPLASGSEAYYRYASGDSLVLDIGGGRRITLRELRVQARRPQWQLIVGSFWFDVATGQLVRAAYRFSTEMDIVQFVREEDPTAFDDVPFWVKPMLFPLRANLEAVTIDYGLFNGVWMPRTQALTASAQASFVRVPITFEERYRYESVTARDDTLPPIALSDAPRAAGEEEGGEASVAVRVGDDDEDDAIGPGAWRTAKRPDEVASPDSLRKLARAAREGGNREEYRRLRNLARAARRDSTLAAQRIQCETTGVRVSRRRLFEGTLPVEVRKPCDERSLATSEELPPSIYRQGDELFGALERGALLQELGFGLQAGYGPRRPKVEFSLADGAVRYNRIEGLSAGVGLSQELGAGWRWRGDARLGLADLQPLGELQLARTNGRRSITGGVYRRLAVGSDWGQPLAFGASVANLLYGRDEGMYHRAWGGEATWRTEPDGRLSVRGFLERQDSAAVESRFALSGGADNPRIRANVQAQAGTWGGFVVRDRRAFGLDPQGWRLFTDVRAEGATGETDYARGLADVTVTRGLGERAALALTASGGTTAGEVPAQRQFFLGSLQTVRGHFIGFEPGKVGNAFWFARSELGLGGAVARPSVYFDAGWAGSRDAWRTTGPEVLQGAGVGLSLLDGLMRFDLARGLQPTRQWRFDFSIEARF